MYRYGFKEFLADLFITGAMVLASTPVLMLIGSAMGLK